MKVIVFGGYGVFGARLVRLLARDGHEVVVAGRNLQKARSLADEVGALCLAIDRDGDLTRLWEMHPDAIVDAAGPFHAYGDDPYALARACISKRVHYLDLADDPAFCAGIVDLDESARAADVFALSGVSSVPALSSAAVAALTEGATEIDLISSAILPGNRAPRGEAVVRSILNQCGLEFDLPVDGAMVPVRSWSRPERFELGEGIIRRGWMIAVPDQRLFSAAFGARTVLFRAGMELGVMNWSLAALSWLRGQIGFGVGRRFIRLILWSARLLAPFGTDQGGMVVDVVARFPDGWRRCRWEMIVTAGEGPFIPAVAARVILRDPAAIAPGARPAIAVFPLQAAEDAASDLAVTTHRECVAITPLFQRFLGAEFDALPPSVRAAHQVYGPRRWAGRASVTRGGSALSRLIGALFRFPQATDDISVQVTMTPMNEGEVWERRFGEQVFRSELHRNDADMTERFGPFTFTLGLHVREGQLHFPVRSGRLGPLRLPKWLLPQSIAHEYEADGKFHFDVALKAPLTGALIVHYKGSLTRENG
jgi:hypothetical protein